MGYKTLLQLEVSPNDGNDALSKEEFSQRLDQIDGPGLEDKFLLPEMYGDGVDGINLRWIFEKKNKLMHKVSLLCPDLIFDLHGDGEDQCDKWSETWKNGRRTELTKPLLIAEFMMDELEKDYPEIYQKLLKKFYARDPNFSVYDDKIIVVNGFEVENTHWQEDLESGQWPSFLGEKCGLCKQIIIS